MIPDQQSEKKLVSIQAFLREDHHTALNTLAAARRTSIKVLVAEALMEHYQLQSRAERLESELAETTN